MLVCDECGKHEEAMDVNRVAIPIFFNPDGDGDVPERIFRTDVCEACAPAFVERVRNATMKDGD